MSRRNEVVWLHCGDQNPVATGREYLAVDPSPWSPGPVARPWRDVDGPRCGDRVRAQRSNEGHRIAMAKAGLSDQPLAARRQFACLPLNFKEPCPPTLCGAALPEERQRCDHFITRDGATPNASATSRTASPRSNRAIARFRMSIERDLVMQASLHAQPLGSIRNRTSWKSPSVTQPPPKSRAYRP